MTPPIESLIFDLLRNLFQKTGTPLNIQLTPDTPLTGSRGILDSLMFVQFLTELEKTIQCRIQDTSYTLLSIQLINSNEAIFKNIQSCCDYIVNILEESNS
jgi:acyl carrier protein